MKKTWTKPEITELSTEMTEFKKIFKGLGLALGRDKDKKDKCWSRS